MKDTGLPKKGPKAPGDNGKGPSGQSDGNDQEPKTTLGPSDCYENQGNGHDGGTDNEQNDHDSSPGPSVVSKITASFMLGLTIAKRCVQPLINHRSVPLFGPRLGEVPQLVSGNETSCVGLVNDHPPIPLLGAGLGEVTELIRGSETGLVENLVERCRINLISKPIPEKPAQASDLEGQPLLEIFTVHTNLCMVNTIGIYDDRGGVLIYKHRTGEKERFIEKRNLWLSKHIGRDPYGFIVKLILTGPSRVLSAHAEGWLIEADVPPESSLQPRTSVTKEIPGGVFPMYLDLDEDLLDKPKTTIIFARGGFVHVTYVVFSNAVRASVQFLLHACPQENLQFLSNSKVQGELTLYVGKFPVGCTIFIKQLEDDAVYFTPCEGLRDNCLAFKLPLTRRVLALPIGSLVTVKGTLMVGSDMEMVVDQSIPLEGSTTKAEWSVGQFFDATICITSSSYYYYY
ncbi:hypothetical protein ACQJBY_025848 [Aegilops geniculata]